MNPSYIRNSKPIIPTYYPQETRQQSVGKENRIPQKQHSCSQIRFINNQVKTLDSFESQKPLELLIEKLKIQVIQLQEEQNTLNEQFQIQIKSLNQRMNTTESSVQQFFNSGISALQSDTKIKEQIKILEVKLGELQLQEIGEQSKNELLIQQTSQKLEQLFKDTILQSEQKIQGKLDQFNNIMKQIITENKQINNCPQQNIDLQRFQQFNDEVQIYLSQNVSTNENDDNLNIIQQTNQQQQLSPNKQLIKNQYKCQMSAISEQTLEESRIEQSVQQYELDSKGFLLLNGTYILDQNGQRYQLSQDQIVYLKSINVIEEINN